MENFGTSVQCQGLALLSRIIMLTLREIRLKRDPIVQLCSDFFLTLIKELGLIVNSFVKRFYPTSKVFLELSRAYLSMGEILRFDGHKKD